MRHVRGQIFCKYRDFWRNCQAVSAEKRCARPVSIRVRRVVIFVVTGADVRRHWVTVCAIGASR